MAAHGCGGEEGMPRAARKRGGRPKQFGSRAVAWHNEGNALVTADFDGDGQDEIVAGWRAGGGGLRLYKATDATGREFKSYDFDSGMRAEGAVAADINGDGKLDLVAIGGRKNQLAWYENHTPAPGKGTK
jgi:hypothetical protein